MGSAATVLVYERGALANTRQKTAAIVERSQELDSSIRSERGEIGLLEDRLKTQKEDLARTARETEEERGARQPVPAGDPTPAKEGFWPSARPYFYLAKEHIPGIEYTAFSSTGGVSKEAAAIFGISAREQREIESTMKGMFTRLHETELKNATLTNTPTDAAGRPGKKISVRVPPSSEAAQLKMEVGGRIAQALGGGDRAALFLDRARNVERDFDSFSTVDRVVTLIPKDEMTGEIIISTESGSSYNYYDLGQEQDWMRFQYEHLLSAFLPEGGKVE